MNDLRIIGSALAILVGGMAACSGSTITFEDDGATGAGASSGPNGSGGSGANSGSGASSTGGRPPICDCDAPYLPVCGVDGTTYDAACGRECVPVDVACNGECPCPSCEDIPGEYRALLDQAKACSADLTVPQCTEKVLDDLPCGCATFVNPSNPAYSELVQLLQQWEQLGCGTDILCEPCSDDPVSGECTPDSGRVDTCTDVRD
jgi:hypothetical protein